MRILATEKARDGFVSQQALKDHYADDGFVSVDEAEFWNERGCGVACVRMALAAYGVSTRDSYGGLAREGRERGFYHESVGWIHRGLATMITLRGLPAEARRLDSLAALIALFRGGKSAILSVTPGLRGGRMAADGHSIAKGGHLVFAFGAEFGDDGGVIAVALHDPDYWPEYSRIGEWVAAETLEASWTGNSIVCG